MTTDAPKKIIYHPRTTKKVGYEHYIPPKINVKPTKVGSAPNNGRGGWAPDYPSSVPTRYPKPAPYTNSLPKWFKEIRAGAEFMPAKIKPVSYNYMALVESPNRAGIYGTSGAATASTMNIGVAGKYNVPTEDVAQGIKTNYNITRDMENLGVKDEDKPGRIMGFFMRAIDLVSRPLYMVENIHLQNVKSDYMSKGSAGGERVTFGEHLQALIDDFTPVGVIKDLAQGQIDDRITAGWRGISGKDKTLTHDVLEQEYPGFSKEHPFLKTMVGIAGDIAFDPLMWVSFGAAGPGTVTKSVAAAGLRGVGKKAAAKKLLEETLLTKTGRTAAADALRLDRFNAADRALARQAARTAGKGLGRINPKIRSMDEARRVAKVAEINKIRSEKRLEDLKGAVLAWKVIKSGIPTAGIGPISKANIGASSWRKVSTAKAAVLKEYESFLDAVTDTFKNDPNWNFEEFVSKDHATGKYKDIKYEDAKGVTHTHDMSHVKTEDEWYREITKLMAPIAEVAEHNIKAAGSRGVRILGTEAKARKIHGSFNKHIEDNIAYALSDEGAKVFNRVRTSTQAIHEAKAAKAGEQFRNPQFLHINEDALHGVTYEQLEQAALKQWLKYIPEGSDAKMPTDHAVVIKDADGTQKFVTLKALHQVAERADLAREQVVKAMMSGIVKGPGDAAAGVGTGASLTREKILNTIAAAREGNASVSEVYNAVLQERLGERLGGLNETSPVLKASGIRFGKNAEGNLTIAQTGAKNTAAVTSYTADVNAEIGMAMLDAYKYAVSYAIHADKMSDPELMFREITNSMEEFVNGATADIKRQVFQLMYNTTGVRLPEDFVPKISDIANIFPAGKRPTFQFKKRDGTLANQDWPWRSLATDMQKWTTRAFPWITPKRFNDVNGTGLDMASFVKDLRAQHTGDMSMSKTATVDTLEQTTVNHIKNLDTLFNATRSGPLNGTTPAVNRYSFSDYLIHGKEILESQSTTMHVTSHEGKLFTRVNSGRLSALDSFGFVGPEVKEAIESLEVLKKIAMGRTPEASYVRKYIVEAFRVDGGFSHLDDLHMPKSSDLADVDFGPAFSTLGIHARIKQGVVTTSKTAKTTSTGAKQRADLMDHFWGTQSLLHEWQKAAHSAILYDTMVTGLTPVQVAERMGKNLDEFFAGHEKLQHILHPTPTAGGLPKAQQLTQELQAEKFGRNRLVAPTEIPKGEFGTAPLSELSKTQPGKPPISGRKVEVNPATTTDPTDFGNVGDLPEFDAAEIARIKEWIAKNYADKPPAKLAHDMHALTMALSGDMMHAQGEIIKLMQDFNIKHGANMKIAGVPLLNLPTGSGMAHAQAGITALRQEQSFARKTFRSLFDPRVNDKWRDQLIKYRKRSNVLNDALDMIMKRYANAAMVSRMQLIPKLNEWEKRIRTGEYVNPSVAAMSTKQKQRHINHVLFDPSVHYTDDIIKQFDLADGTNPVREVMENFDIVGTRMFPTWDTMSFAEKRSQLNRYNRYMEEDYRLSKDDVKGIIEAEELTGYKTKDMIPYSTEWIRAVGELRSASKLGSKKLKEINTFALQYAIHDSHIKRESGDLLHKGVFDEFSTMMQRKHVDYYNNKVVPQTVDSKGEQMRARLINVKDITGGKNPIPPEYIPAQFKDGNYYISEDMVPEISLLFNYMDQIHALNDTINAGFMDNILNIFKKSVTVWNVPTYPIRNLQSDVFLSAMDGLVNPRFYGDAAAVVWNARQDMKTMDPKDFEGILADDFLKGNVSRALNEPQSVMNPAVNPNKPVRIKLRTQSGEIIELNDDQIYRIYSQMNLGQANAVGADIPQSVAAARRGKVGRGAGAVDDKLRSLNDIREDWGRMAHFLYAIESEAPLGGGLDDIMRRAGDRVIKHHFDYTDVSLWERKTLARWIPFYKWTKNIIPYTLANVIMKPRYLNVERAISKTAAEVTNQFDQPDEGGQDFIVADFIRHDVPVPIGTWSDPEGYKFQQFALMYLPIGQTLSQPISNVLDPLMPGTNEGAANKAAGMAGGIGATILSMLNPAAKTVIQAGTGQVNYPTGHKEGDPGDLLKTAGAIVPGWAAFDQLQKTATPLFGGGEGATGQNQAAQLLAALGAMRVYNNTENVQKGQNKQTEDRLRGALNKRKTEISAAIKEKYPQLSDDEVKQVIDEILKRTRKSDAARL